MNRVRVLGNGAAHPHPIVLGVPPPPPDLNLVHVVLSVHDESELATQLTCHRPVHGGRLLGLFLSYLPKLRVLGHKQK